MALPEGSQSSLAWVSPTGQDDAIGQVSTDCGRGSDSREQPHVRSNYMEEACSLPAKVYRKRVSIGHLGVCLWVLGSSLMLLDL